MKLKYIIKNININVNKNQTKLNSNKIDIYIYICIYNNIRKYDLNKTNFKKAYKKIKIN